MVYGPYADPDRWEQILDHQKRPCGSMYYLYMDYAEILTVRTHMICYQKHSWPTCNMFEWTVPRSWRWIWYCVSAHTNWFCPQVAGPAQLRPWNALDHWLPGIQWVSASTRAATQRATRSFVLIKTRRGAVLLVPSSCTVDAWNPLGTGRHSRKAPPHSKRIR